MMDWLTNLFPSDLHQRVVTGVVIFLATTVASLLIGRWWGRYKAMREWGTKHFMDRVIVSLNNFSDGYLKIRTIFERSLDQVFINSAAVTKIREASKRTTAENPIIPIEKADRWFLLNYVLNAVAEEFNEGLVRYDAGLPAKPFKYLLFLTCEQVGPHRVRKVRVMMIRQDMLQQLPTEMPKLEQPWHADRMNTLTAAAKLHQTEPDNFLMLEVYV